jgi:hypothetical protein
MVGLSVGKDISVSQIINNDGWKGRRQLRGIT